MLSCGISRIVSIVVGPNYVESFGHQGQQSPERKYSESKRKLLIDNIIHHGLKNMNSVGFWVSKHEYRTQGIDTVWEKCP